MAINKTKFLPPSKGMPLAKVTKISTAKIGSKKPQGKNYIKEIHANVIKIEKILKGTLAFEKKQLGDKRKEYEKESRSKEEEKLETKEKKPEKKKLKMPKVPGMGMLGWIKNFIGNIILGFFAIKLLDHLPKLIGFMKVAAGVIDFISDIGVGLVDGFATFIDWGYKAYDATKGFLKNFGVSGDQFDKFSGALSGIIDALVIASVVLAARGQDGGEFGGASKGRGPGTRTTGRGGQKPRTRIPGTGPKITQGSGGKSPKVRIPGTGPKVTGSGGPKMPKVPKVTGIKGAKSGGLLGLVMLIPTLFEVGGLFSQGYWKTGANVLASTLAGIAAASTVYSGVVAGAAALTGVTAGFGSPAAVALLLGGLAASGVAGWGAYEITSRTLKAIGLRDDELKSQGYQEGGQITKKRDKKGKVKRGIKSTANKKIKRIPQRKPSFERIPSPPAVEIKPGEPTPRAWWDFFGVFTGGNKTIDLGPSGAKLSNRITDVGNSLGGNDYFGPILGITSKIILGDKIDEKDYRNVGLGINLLVNDGINRERIARGLKGFSDGGKVEGSLMPVDVNKWVTDSFKTTIRKDIAKKYEDIGVQKPKEGEAEDTGTYIDSATGFGSAGASGDALTMARNLMRDLNITEAQASGIVGNMVAESGVENARPQNTPPGTKGPLVVDGVTGYGIVQWTSKGRQQKLADFAKSRGADLSKPLSMDVEYQFFLKELKEDYGNVLQQIREASDTKTASTIFMQQYEIPAGYKTQAKIMERYNLSRPIYEKLKSGQGSATIASPSSSQLPGNISSGTGGNYERSSRGTKIAGDLGRYIYKTLSTPRDFSQASEHPDFGGSFTRSYRSWHNVDRAIDIGGYWPQDQKKILAKIMEFNSKYNLQPVELLYGKPGTPKSGTHQDHVHVAYERGGMTLSEPHLALMGEKGTEIVIDADSSEYKPVANMLLAINKASTKEGVLNAIRNYAPYDSRSHQFIIIDEPNSEDYDDDYVQSGMSFPIATSSYDDPFEFLDYQG